MLQLILREKKAEYICEKVNQLYQSLHYLKFPTGTVFTTKQNVTFEYMVKMGISIFRSLCAGDPFNKNPPPGVNLRYTSS